jgi:sugar/nucleoside kinase (ribokinase family)
VAALTSSTERRRSDASFQQPGGAHHDRVCRHAQRRPQDICFYRNPGADALLNSVDLRPAILEGAQLFHCGSVTLSQSPAREAQFRAAKMAIERDVLISFDPNWRPSIWSDTVEAHALIWEMITLSDIVKVADEEWEFITGTSDFEKAPPKSALKAHVWWSSRAARTALISTVPAPAAA